MAGRSPLLATRKARQMFMSSYRQELEERGVLAPSKNCSPLWPPWSNVEYEALERDTAKYFLYYCAINAACSDFAKERPNTIINILVLGPGRGRLVEYSIDCLNMNNLKGVIQVIESNVSCCNVLEEKYSDVTNVYVHPPMTIRDSDEILSYIQSKSASSSIKLLSKDKNIDIIVSELFGSFPDNEFMPEILRTCIELFGTEKCFSIPAEYESFIMPVFSAELQRYFGDYESSNGCVESLFVLGLPYDAIVLSKPKSVWRCSCCLIPPVNQSIVEFEHNVGNQFYALAESFKSTHSESEVSESNAESLLDENMASLFSRKENNGQLLDVSSTLLAIQIRGSPLSNRSHMPEQKYSIAHSKGRSCRVTGFAGHFTAVLYKDIGIDTRPTCTRNTYSWESAFFPLNSITRNKLDYVLSSENNVVSFKMRRVIEKIFIEKRDCNDTVDHGNPRPLYRLYYEWAVVSRDGEIIGNNHNENGKCHTLYL